MHTHYFQHVPFEGLSSIENWLQEKRHHISATRFYEDAQLPHPNNPDFLIVMGGPMGVHDVEQYPWLTEEKQFIRDFIDTEKPVLGICLGAQLIASALGAKVSRNPHKEIGWWPIQGCANESHKHFAFPDELTVFHWHGDTFDIPNGAQRIATNTACANQAFQYGNSVIGLQFHIELTPHSIDKLIDHCAEDITEGPYVQSQDSLMHGAEANHETARQYLHALLECLTRSP